MGWLSYTVLVHSILVLPIPYPIVDDMSNKCDYPTHSLVLTYCWLEQVNDFKKLSRTDVIISAKNTIYSFLGGVVNVIVSHLN